MNKKLILIIGAPGSGKTTDATLVAQNHTQSITSYSLGDLLKDEVKKENATGRINNSFISKGELVPTAIAIDTICSAVQNAPTDIVLLDGFPRKEKQMRLFADILSNRMDKVELVSVIEVRVSESVARERVLGRDESREDDKEEIFNNRMKIYNETIEEIEKFYKDSGLLKVIDGEREPKEIVAEIDAFLESQIPLELDTI